ncbi:lytic transglycosylase domain-containing protein [Candidatus Parcubacteria bacterium]|nr:lytic transglycosylase domain-containing protein [Candidatus Parcubacteria bacterium]
MSLTASLSVAALAIINSATLSQASVKADVMPQAQTVKEYVEEYFADEPVMVSIAECESHFKQFDKDGNVLKNSKGSSAVGMFQIMSSVHDDTADKLGLDINSIQGNAAYARYLYEKHGTTPWKASKACWGKKTEHLAVK